MLYKKLKKIVERKVTCVIRREMKKISNAEQLEATYESSKFVCKNLSNSKIFINKFELLEYCIHEFLRDKTTEELILEFGVYKGSTINFIAEKIGKNKRVFGFDCFEGLPEDWRRGFEKGMFSLNQLPEVHENVKLVKGYFDETLPKFLEENQKEVAFLHIDCDLYSSTKCIFDCLGSLIHEGTIIVFDEFFNYPDWKEGEFKAWSEFVEKNNIKFEYIGYVDDNEQMAVKIK